MLTLEPGSICDVCADEYNARNLPHSIPCGHVLCLSCCTSIVEKTPLGKAPMCPFCRDPFARSSVRKIRIDFLPSTSSTAPGSGWSTPRRSPRSPRAPLIEDDFPNDLLLKVNAAVSATAMSNGTTNDDAAERRVREARRLESRVLKVASQKTSVDEVTTLMRELEDWLGHNDKNHSEISTSLYLSALLLRAIISNHFAFSEATKAAKSTESSLRARVDDLERDRARLDVEVHKLTHQLQKASSARTPPTSPPSTRVSSPTAQVASPSSPSPLSLSSSSASTHTAATSHFRSASVAPITSIASHIPMRTTTPAPNAYRSAAPTPSPSRSTHAITTANNNNGGAAPRPSRTMSISGGPTSPGGSSIQRAPSVAPGQRAPSVARAAAGGAIARSSSVAPGAAIPRSSSVAPGSVRSSSTAPHAALSRVAMGAMPRAASTAPDAHLHHMHHHMQPHQQLQYQQQQAQAQSQQQSQGQGQSQGQNQHARWLPDMRAVAADAQRPVGPRVPVAMRG